MMRKIYLSALLLLSTSSAFALLPPLYESIKEIQTILDNPIFSNFAGEQILSITKEEGGYNIETTNYFFFAEIQTLPSKKIGPLEFTVIIKEPIRKQP